MSTDARTRRAHFLESISHYVTAFVIIMKGVGKLDHPEKMGYSIIFILIGVLLALATFFHHRFEHLIRNFKGYVYFVESLVMGIVAYLYFHEGKHYIQYVCLAVSLAYLVALIIFIRRRKPHAAH